MGRIALAVAAVLMLANGSPAVAELVFQPKPGTGSWNTMANGGFETGDLTSWQDIPQWQGGYDVVLGTPYSGSYSVRPTATNAFFGAGFALPADLATVTAGETYVLSAFFNTSDLTSGNLYVDMSDVAFERSIGCFLQNRPLTLGHDGWFFAYEEFTVPSGVNSIRVRIVRDGDVKVGEYGYVDEVAVTLQSNFVSPIPEPTTLALFGIGLAGLVAWRRKRRKAA